MTVVDLTEGGSRVVGSNYMTTARGSVAFLLAVGLLAIPAQVSIHGGINAAEMASAAGLAALVALLGASFWLRTHPAPSWTASQGDPFLAFAGSLVLLLLPAVSGSIGALRSSDPGLSSEWWWTGAIAACLAGVGFVTMLRDTAPGRVLNAVYLSAIAATGLGLFSWVAILRLEAKADLVASTFGLLGIVMLDVAVVGLGLQAWQLRSRARTGCLLLLLAWTAILVSDVSRLLDAVAGDAWAGEPIVAPLVIAFALLGAAALHPHTTVAHEPVFGPLDRLSGFQVALLTASVVLGPGILAVGVDADGALSAVLPLSAALSLLVVAHLVRLVQGRAVFEHRAHHDELTGLANRTLFEERASIAIAHARRTHGHCAVLFLDLDRFKAVNDSLGHATGNLLLQEVARRLRATTHLDDTVARLGGDEFVVFMPQIASAGQATALATEILTAFEEAFNLHGHRVFASPSIGIAICPGDAIDADALLKCADTAMYRAKQRGRRTFCLYDQSMKVHGRERLALENGLHTAVERGELRLHYQPKVHIPTGRVTGAEALLRWQHPELGLIGPSEFISIAEESGMIVPLGEWALEEACRQNKRWTDAGFGPLVVAVNLSVRQFQQQQAMADLVARILRSTGLDPTQLELEVTESLATQDPEEMARTLLEIREMGVSCSIDDFGTGYSGLSHLMQFPIDKLKLDKSFVATIDTDREAPIVVAVLALAHGLGLGVVAEGVETTEQLDRLRELGCDEMQGYLFSRPLPADRFEQLLMLESVAPGPGRLVESPRPALRLIDAG